MEDFKAAVKEGKHKEKGWPESAYGASKAGNVGMTKTIAMEQKKAGKNVFINVCCPGYVKTDMTRGGGAKTPDEGAQTPVMLAVGEFEKKTGDFWQNEKILEW